MPEIDLPKIETNYKYAPHMILLSIIFIFQFSTKSHEVKSNLNPEQKKKGDKIFWKYIIVFQIAKAADWCLGPFVFEFFERYHNLSTEGIGRMIAVSFLSSMLLGPLLVGYLNDKSDRKFPCLLYGIFLSVSCLIRQINHPLALIISQILYGICSSVLYTSFENWFIAETNLVISDKDVKEIVFASAFEKSMIGDSLAAVGVSFITGSLKRVYGIQAPYFFSAFLCLISLISVALLVTSIEKLETESQKEESKHDFIDVFINIKDSLGVCKRQPFIILIGLTESLLFAVLHIFIFIWTPILREAKESVDTSEVFTLFMMALMVGGSSFRVK